MPDATPSDPKLLILVGLPGSGKSTWAREQGYHPVASDDIRLLLADDATDQSINREVFGTVRYLLRRRLELRRPVTVLDATNLTPKERKPYIVLARLHGHEVEAVWFDTPAEVCKARNRARGRVVPEEVIDAMAARMRRPDVEEGFSAVTVVPASAPGS